MSKVINTVHFEDVFIVCQLFLKAVKHKSIDCLIWSFSFD